MSEGMSEAAAKHLHDHDRVRVWDLGPPKPVEPPQPALPAGFEDDAVLRRAVHHILVRYGAAKLDPREEAMIRFRRVLDAYDREYSAYLEEKAKYDAFWGKPKRISMSHDKASEALSRYPNRYRRFLP
jgi:hypothetical protein